MMKRQTTRLAMVLAFVLLPLMATSLSAQMVMHFDGETDIKVGAGKWHGFHISVENQGSVPVSFYVKRTLSEVPSSDWFSTICTDVCFTPETSQTDPVEVAPGSTFNVEFTVYTGDELESEGHFALKFVTSGFTGSEFGEVGFTVSTTEDISSVPAITEAAHLPYPNPAVTDVQIPLEALSSVERVEVFNLAGAMVGTYEGNDVAEKTLRIETADLAPGVYYYKLVGDSEARVGTFHVIR